MNIPIYPSSSIVNDDNELSPSWEIFFSQMQNELIDNVSNNGFVIPGRTNSEISQIAVEENQDCRLLYNTDTNQLIVIKLGTIIVLA